MSANNEQSIPVPVPVPAPVPSPVVLVPAPCPAHAVVNGSNSTGSNNRRMARQPKDRHRQQHGHPHNAHPPLHYPLPPAPLPLHHPATPHHSPLPGSHLLPLSRVSSPWLPSYAPLLAHHVAVARRCHGISALLSPAFLLATLEPSWASHECREFLFRELSALIADLSPIAPFLFGSVPLHTYLPHGDIDVGILVESPQDDSTNDDLLVLAQVKARLEAEAARHETDPTALPIHSVTLVAGAEIKLVKFSVASLRVDISTNTIGALATVCALEDIDQEIDAAIARLYPRAGTLSHLPSNCRCPRTGRPHLFKRSILLIKAWCLYESEILASNASQLSTYAIEALIVYCINHYHHLLHHTESDPFLVLSIFVHVFANFNFEEWAVCVTGPVRIEDLVHPSFAAHHLFALSSAAASIPPSLAAPFQHSSAPLLSPAYFYSLYVNYAVPVAAPRSFAVKHINVVDPLDLANNLGRSVSFAALWKIRLALKQALPIIDGIIGAAHDLVDECIAQFGDESIDQINDLEPAHFQAAVEASERALLPAELTTEILARIRANFTAYRSFFARTLARHAAPNAARPDVELVTRIQQQHQAGQPGDELTERKKPTITEVITVTPSKPSPASGSHALLHSRRASSHSAVTSPAARFFALSSHSPSLSRDDSSIASVRSPSSGRSLFISTLPINGQHAHAHGHGPPHSKGERDEGEGSFSPLIEPTSCPPGVSLPLSSHSHSRSHSPSLQSTSGPASPASPDLLHSPQHSPSSAEPTDPLAASLPNLVRAFHKVRQRCGRQMSSTMSAMGFAPPTFLAAAWRLPGHVTKGRGGDKRRERTKTAAAAARATPAAGPASPVSSPALSPAHATARMTPVNGSETTSAPAPSLLLPTVSTIPQRHPQRRQYVHSPHHQQTNGSSHGHHLPPSHSSPSSGLGAVLANPTADAPHLAAKVSAFLLGDDEDSLAQAMVENNKLVHHSHPHQHPHHHAGHSHFRGPPKGERRDRSKVTQPSFGARRIPAKHDGNATSSNGNAGGGNGVRGTETSAAPG